MATPRKSLSKRTRFEVFKRDDFQCRYCGARAPETLLHIDHIIPVVDGGTNALDNLVAACDGCNLGKGAKSLGDKAPPVAADAPKEMRAKAEQLAAYRKAMAEWIEERAEFETEVAVSVYNALWGHVDPGKMLPPSAAKSAVYLVQQLGFRKVIELAEYTGSMTRKFSTYFDAYKYFYACCRNVLRQEGGME